MKYVKTFEDYDPDADYILYMEKEKANKNWIRVDNETREKLFNLIYGDIESFEPAHCSKKFIATLSKDKKKVLFTTADERFTDYISVEIVRNKLT